MSGGGRTTQDEWQRLFERFDTDHNDRLNLAEFEAALTKKAGLDKYKAWVLPFVRKLFNLMNQDHVHQFFH